MAARPQVGSFHGTIEAVDLTYGVVNPTVVIDVGVPDMRYVLSLIGDEKGNRILTEEQISYLLGIKINQKESLFTAYSPTSAMMIAEYGSLLRSMGFERATEILVRNLQANKLDLTWENPSIRSEIEESKRIRDTETKVEARDDIGVCIDCGSNMVIQVIKQLRRADEAATVIRTCAKCRSRRIKVN